MSKIIDDITSKYLTISNINFFSDGSGSQIKNKFVFQMSLLHDVHVALLIHDLHLQWHFFAPSDGKETVDGIGGSISVSSLVMWSVKATL